MNNFLGFKWLSLTYGIEPVHPFRTISELGVARQTSLVDGFTHEIYTAQFTPQSTLAGHLTFALKHEAIHLEFLARLFHKTGPEPVEQWIASEPTGAYARRAGFFYEWLTGSMLRCAPVASGNYVNAINPDTCFAAAKPVNNSRWRVRDNLPGAPSYCPIVSRTSAVIAAEQMDCAKALNELDVEFGGDILMRCAVWLTIKESRSSFAIEHEEKQLDRVKRFAGVMEECCGKSPSPLSAQHLTDLQKEILGPVSTSYGMRASPVYVGHTSGFTAVVDFVAPHWEQVEALMEGLQVVESRTRGTSPVVRAAILSFGFVYIHPMSDGNGRISRFIVNDILRRDNAVPAPYILPISATITRTASARADYDQVLERFSRPLMARYKSDYRFGKEQLHDDGIRSNFYFDSYDDALFAWRFPDLTSHVAYLSEVIGITISGEMSREAAYLRNLMAARERVKNLMEAPNAHIDQIIRSITENGWRVSNKLTKAFPLLASVPGLSDRVIASVRAAFDSTSQQVDAEGEEEPPVQPPG